MALSFLGNGTITGLSVGGLPDGCVDSDTLSAGTGGKVLQVLQNVKADTQSISGNTFTTVLTQAITPATTSSKVLIHVNLNVTGSVRYSAIKLYRDSTQIFLGDAASNRSQVSVASLINESAGSSTDMMYHSSLVFLDSPSSSSEVIYYVKCANTYTGGVYGTGATTYINRTPTDSDGDYSHRGASSLIVQEISA